MTPRKRLAVETPVARIYPSGDEGQSHAAPFGPDIWRVDGPTVTAAAGFHFPTRMAVIRLADGLMLWSPVQPVPGLIDAVQALGPVRHLVAPNRLYNLYLALCQAACPGAILHGAPGLQARCPDLMPC